MKMPDKDCGNCKYDILYNRCEPCCNCFSHEKWEPKEYEDPKGLINMNYAEHVYKFVHDEYKDLDSTYLYMK